MDTHVRRSPTDAEPSRRTVGIDVGGTKTLGLLVEHGPAGVAVLDRERVPSRADDPSAVDAVVGVARTLTERSRNRAGEAVPVPAPVTAVGVGLAGFVDRDGVVRAAPNSVGLVGQDVRGRLERELGLPVTVDNDANCAAVAAHALIEPTVADLVAVTLGTGIGGGLIVGGRLVRGARGFAGEPGHMVVDPDGPRCPCGQHGCWERYASGSGLGWLARRALRRGDAPSLAEAVADPEELRGEHVTELLGVGNRDAVRVFDEYAGWVALGVANLISLLDPDVVALGGGVAAVGDELTGRVRTILSERFPAASDGRSVSIVTTPGGPDAGAIGAAILARDAAAAEPEPGSGRSGDRR
ncbi:MAG TPA: ROK family protein [Microthrixaceae bacterium]|nr:ROK family protein [Microthrixaceae bacterium]